MRRLQSEAMTAAQSTKQRRVSSRDDHSNGSKRREPRPSSRASSYELPYPLHHPHGALTMSILSSASSSTDTIRLLSTWVSLFMAPVHRGWHTTLGHESKPRSQGV